MVREWKTVKAMKLVKICLLFLAPGCQHRVYLGPPSAIRGLMDEWWGNCRHYTEVIEVWGCACLTHTGTLSHTYADIHTEGSGISKGFGHQRKMWSFRDSWALDFHSTWCMAAFCTASDILVGCMHFTVYNLYLQRPPSHQDTCQTQSYFHGFSI